MVNVSVAPVETLPAVSVAQTRNRAVVFEASESDAVSAVPVVRERLVRIQRDEVAAARADGEGIVVEGRDITTVVLPDADLKVFITADPGERARRRAAQDVDLGKASVDVQATKQALLQRDAKDSGRLASPLTIADDAVVVDTTDLSLDEVVEQLCALIDALPSP